MAKTEHHKKKDERENTLKLLTLLKKHGSLSFSQMRSMLDISSPTLSIHLKKLEDGKAIEQFRLRSADGLHQGYRIRKESAAKVEADIGKFEAVRFIEGIVNPIYIYEPSPDQRKAIAVFMSRLPNQKEHDFYKKQASWWLSLGKRFLREPAKGQQIAVVLMTKGAEQNE
jgi:DNA-binding Lrp family transcriptional regulator